MQVPSPAKRAAIWFAGLNAIITYPVGSAVPEPPSAAAQLRRELFSSPCVWWLNTKALKGVWHCAPFFGWVWFPLSVSVAGAARSWSCGWCA